MTDHTCQNCFYYKQPEDEYSCGQCKYPVPDWLNCGVISGGFVQGYKEKDNAE